MASNTPLFVDSVLPSTEGYPSLRSSFNCKSLKLLAGTQLLSKLFEKTREVHTNCLWCLTRAVPTSITHESIEALTDVSSYGWIQTTKYGQHVAILTPTSDLPMTSNGHPQINRTTPPTQTAIWTILPRQFPNDAHNHGKGRIESYIGATPPHYVYYLPTSGNPKDINPAHYIYFPEALRATLFIGQSHSADARRDAAQVIAQAQPFSSPQPHRQNPNAITLLFLHPIGEAQAQEVDQQQPPRAANPDRQREVPNLAPPEWTQRLEQLEQRITRHERSTNEQITHLNDRASGVENSLFVHQRFERELLNRVSFLQDTRTSDLERHMGNLNTDMRLQAESLDHNVNDIHAHINYLYYILNRNPHVHLPPLNPIDDTYLHAYTSSATESSPYKVPRTDTQPVARISETAIRNITHFLPSLLLTFPESQAPPIHPPKPLIAVANTPTASNRSPLRKKWTSPPTLTKNPETRAANMNIVNMAPVYHARLPQFLRNYQTVLPHLLTKIQNSWSTRKITHDNVYPNLAAKLTFPTPTTRAQPAIFSTNQTHFIECNPPIKNNLSSNNHNPKHTTHPHTSYSCDHHGHTQIVILVLNNRKRYYHSPFPPTLQIFDLLQQLRLHTTTATNI